jgi:hypothetical protein
MRRLLWKEFRERWGWGLLWVLMILGASHFGQLIPFWGEGDTSNVLIWRLNGLWRVFWNFVFWLMPVVVGYTVWLQEAKHAKAAYPSAPPVAWHYLFLAKLLFGGVIMVGALLLAALVFRLTCHEVYRPFATPMHLLTGAWPFAWKMGLIYFALLSHAAPDLVIRERHRLSAISARLFSAVAGLGGIMLTMHFGIHSVLPFPVPTPLSLAAHWSVPLALVLFGLLAVMHQGISLTGRERSVLASISLLCLAVYGTILFLLAPQMQQNRWTAVQYRVSPDGAFLAMEYEQTLNAQERKTQRSDRTRYSELLIMRRTDLSPIMRIHGTAKGEISYFSWMSDQSLIVHRLNQADEFVNVINRSAHPLPDARYGFSSPDHRLLVVMRSAVQEGKELLFLDAVSGQIVQRAVTLPHEVRTLWWQSHDTIGYMGKDDTRHFIRVPGGAQAETPAGEGR